MPPSSVQEAPTKLPNPPRQVRRRKNSNAGAVLGILVFGAMVMVGIVFVARELLYEWVAAKGQAVTAEIDRRESREVHDKHGSHLDYYLHYHFTLAGAEHTDEQRVHSADYERIDPPIQLPARATQIGSWTLSVLSVPRADRAWIAGAILLGIFGLISTIAAVSSARLKHLVQEGTAVPGQVISQRTVRGKSTTYYIKYRFTAKNAGTFEQQRALPRKLFDKLTPGTAITVLYDPNNPKRSLAYEACPFEVVPAVELNPFRV